MATQLRAAGIAVSHTLTNAKFNKQFKAAEQIGAPLALVIGSEYPEVSLKTLATREETKLHADESLVETILKSLKK